MSLYTDTHFPKPQGLYHPGREHEACGLAVVANVNGETTHAIVADGLRILCNLTHRGATGADPATGDGAGILLQQPHRFFAEVVPFSLPTAGEYASGNVFLPKDPDANRRCQSQIETAIHDCGLEVLGWRVPETDNSALGKGALEAEPGLAQLFVGRGEVPKDRWQLVLYRARRRAEGINFRDNKQEGEQFYICSLSSKTIVYKGMFLADQLGPYYADLTDERLKSAVALVHQRFSTNTFPSWKLAHPYRYIAHNGEFNTIQGNINMMRSRESLMACAKLGSSGIDDLKPVIYPGQSDSASFDNALELLLHTGRTLPEALAMMIPEAWISRKHMPADKRDFYLYHANLMEPWDGPAAVGAFDGRHFCAILDRNGLRPSRFCITKDNRFVYGSEAGMLAIKDEDIVYKSRLWPGQIVMVDFEDKKVREDEEIKAAFINKKPYGDWLQQGMVHIEDLPDPIKPPKALRHEVHRFQRHFGYTEEELKDHLTPMAINAQEAVGAMGDDTPMAILSRECKLLHNYFRQKFAQVTNPPIDPIREELVMSSTVNFGAGWNIFEDGPEYCMQLRLLQPFLTNYELEQIAQARTKTCRGTIIPMLAAIDGGPQALAEALERIFERAENKIYQGYNVLILSDRKIDEDHAAIPAVLAVSALHHHLIRKGKRGNIGIVVETGEARLVHHMAVLFGYGASAINPYLAFESIRDLRDKGVLPAFDGNQDDYEDPCAVYDRNYIRALGKGLMKIMSKMGISTLLSYRGAQVFEAIGLSQELVDKYFTGTISQLGGLGLSEIYRGMQIRHQQSFSETTDRNRELEWGGEHRWRPDGEHHQFNPETIALLRHAVQAGDYQLYKRYAGLINNQEDRLATIRGALNFVPQRNPVPLNEVEPETEIFKRFCTGAMSLGALSPEAHETLAIAMNRIGGKSNSGEGGEDPARFEKDANGDLRRSAIKQVASGRFGVTTHYLVNADELQIKVSQGAKPGEGGQLPGHKVSPYIASLRRSIPGVTLISPPPHHDIYSIEDLAQLIFDLKNVNPEADIAVKLVSEFGVGTVAAGVAKAHAEVVVIAGCDGGTGASPMSSIKHAGTPWELGLSETHQTLLLNGLRDRIRIQVDGQMKTGRDVVIATLLGAEEYGFATAALVAEGCIMMRKCHLDTCPVGIATQNPELRKNYEGKAEHVINFMTFIARDTREIMAELGFRTIDEMVGQTEYLGVASTESHWKTENLDLENILFKPTPPAGTGLFCTKKQDHGLDLVLDHQLIDAAKEVFSRQQVVNGDFPITTANRTTGAMLAGKLTKKFGETGLPAGTVRFHFSGSSGQSFGAFLIAGMDFRLSGEANDYLGKGMSGGMIVVRPPAESKRIAQDNWIAGNTLLYGATGGKVFISGKVGERFAVRNSGCEAVVEGVGDHGCEYMTGGKVVILGPTGRNFAAGMSGGTAFVMDGDHLFSRRCNHGMVDIERPTKDDMTELRALIEEHLQLTASRNARRILDNWAEESMLFVKVMPREYRKIMAKLEKQRQRKKG